MKSYWMLFFLFVIHFSWSQTTSKAIGEISTEEFKEVVLIDVRTPEEFKAGHIASAININWFDSDFMQQIEAIVSKDKSVYVYCKSGGRSSKVTEKLETTGYKVTNLTGGYDAYTTKHKK